MRLLLSSFSRHTLRNPIFRSRLRAAAAEQRWCKPKQWRRAGSRLRAAAAEQFNRTFIRGMFLYAAAFVRLLLSSGLIQSAMQSSRRSRLRAAAAEQG